MRFFRKESEEWYRTEITRAKSPTCIKSFHRRLDTALMFRERDTAPRREFAHRGSNPRGGDLRRPSRNPGFSFAPHAAQSVDSAIGRLAQHLAKRRAIRGLEHPAVQFRLHEVAGPADSGTRDDGAAARHGLIQSQAPGLPRSPRRQNENIAQAIDRGHRALILHRHEMHAWSA